MKIILTKETNVITSEYINRAIDYILSHINENISAHDVASHCNFSKHYFSRMFKIETGEGIYEFIKRMKMEQSAFRLKSNKIKNITDIGLDYGYSASNYSSAFKKHHNISPARFRDSIFKKSLKNPIFHNVLVKFDTFEECSSKISIEVFSDFPVILERHKGSYIDLSDNWNKFLKKHKEYITDKTLFIERTYDDPAITNIDECLYDICMTMPEGYKFKNSYVIRGGKFAVYHFKGSVKQIYFAYQNIFSVWLSKSGFEIDERYGFEIYRKIDCGSMNMEIDICIPIK